jgi:sugar/nucleoside kinase (ribokinase family)
MTLAHNEVDYLAIGHVAHDLNNEGYTLGGSVAYAGRTAAALGWDVGIITSSAESTNLDALDGIQIFNLLAAESTTFENVYTQRGRMQILHSVSRKIEPVTIPSEWNNAKLVHLAPIANEVDQQLVHHFSSAFIGLTPQGWLRRWDDSGLVFQTGWEAIEEVIQYADATVISTEDLQGDERAATELAQLCPILALTKGSQGAIIYLEGEPNIFNAPAVEEVDPTGSGDIFAAAFFIRLQETGDPLEAGIMATELASKSVTGPGIKSVPSPSFIRTLRDRLKQ